MNLTALKSLVRIDQVSSFSKAAELENMTLSALSMQMKTLESQLGVALFDRAFRPPQLTPLGRQIAQQAGKVVVAQKELQHIATSPEPLAGHFRLGFIPSASVRLLPGFLQIVRDYHQSAEVSVSSGLSEDLSDAVSLGALDAALVTRVAVPDRNLRFHSIAKEDMVFAAPKGKNDWSLTELAKELPFIHFRPSSGIGRLIHDAVQQFDPKPRQIIVLDSIEAAMECVKSGLGYTLLPKPDVQRCADARVQLVAGSGPANCRDLVLAVHHSNAKSNWSLHLAKLLRQLA